MLKLTNLTTLISILVLCYTQVKAQAGFLAINNEISHKTRSNKDFLGTDLMDFKVGVNELDSELEYENEHGSNWENKEYSWEQEEELSLEALVGVNVSQVMPNEEYLLPPAAPPPGREGEPVYTLVLDMDETLLHYQMVNGKGKLYIRPHAEQFLKAMNPLYQIVIFTGGVQGYANRLLNMLDPNRYIDYRLYRQDTIRDPKNPLIFIKDLSKLGRDLSKTLIIDNTPQNFQLQPQNGLPIASYYTASKDTALMDFVPFLRNLVEDNVPDVRKSIALYKKEHNEA